MKQLIPQSKIDEAANISSHNVPELYNQFNAGVQFALNEIQPLMFQFGKYCFNMARNPNDKTTSFEQLFEEFINEKSK